MDTTLAILMALGIYLVIPLIIGFAIGGIFILSDRRIRREQRARTTTVVETEVDEPVKTSA